MDQTGPVGPMRTGWTRLNESEANGVLGSADASRSPTDLPLTSLERIIIVMAQFFDYCQSLVFGFGYHKFTTRSNDRRNTK